MFRHLRLLFWLRWKYLWRASLQRRAGFVISILISFLFAFLFGSLLWSLIRKGEQSGGAEDFMEYSTVGCALLTFFWLYFSSLSDLYDPQRLLPYPIRPTTLFWGSCISSVIGVMPIHAAWIGIPFVFARPAGAGLLLFRALWFPVLIAHLVATSRLIRLVFLQLLTSRRWREAAVIVSTVLGGSLYLGMRGLQSDQVSQLAGWMKTQVEAHRFTHWLAWLPSSWFARALEADGAMAWIAAAGYVAATVGIVLLGGWAERRLAFSEPVFSAGPKRKVTAGGPPRFLTGIVARIGRIAGDPAAAVARKELSVLARDPTVRSRLLASLFYIFIPLVGPFLLKTGVDRQYVPDMVGGAMLWLELSFFLNLFGTEGTGLRAMTALPTDRHRIMLGKNLCYAILFLPLNVIALSIATAAFGAPIELPRNLAFHATAFLSLLGAGNLFSLYFPWRLLTPGQRLMRNEDDQGCMMALLRMAAFFGVMVITAPVFVARFACTMGGLPWPVQVILVVASMIYGGGFYVFALWLSGRLFARREERLVELFAKA